MGKDSGGMGMGRGEARNYGMGRTRKGSLDGKEWIMSRTTEPKYPYVKNSEPGDGWVQGCVFYANFLKFGIL